MDDFLRRISIPISPTESQPTENTEPAASKLTSGGISDVENVLESANQAGDSSALQSNDPSPTFHINRMISGEVSVGNLLSAEPPKVSWDTILAVKEELSKDNPDWQKIFQMFQNLSPADQAATFGEMAKDGDFNQGGPMFNFIQNLPPEAHDALANFLGPLISAQNHARAGGTDTSSWLSYGLSMAFNAMNDGTGKFADTVRDLWHTGLPEFNTDQGEKLIEILNQDPAPEHRLFDLEMMSTLAQNNPGTYALAHLNAGYDVDAINQEIDSYLDNFMNGTQTIPPPGLSEWFQNCPVQAMQELRSISSSGKMDDFVNQMLQSGDNIAKPLAQALGDYYPFSGFSYVFQDFFQALAAHKDNPMADDIARDMVNTISNAKNTILTGLSSLSPAALIDLKLILEAGDDQDLDSQALSLVNQAYKTATGS